MRLPVIREIQYIDYKIYYKKCKFLGKECLVCNIWDWPSENSTLFIFQRKLNQYGGTYYLNEKKKKKINAEMVVWLWK